MTPACWEHMFGGERDPKQVADERRCCCARPSTGRPTSLALRTVRSRTVAGIGEDSAGELCERATRALAGAIDIEPTLFPGGHTGFADDPERFAARLPEILAESS